MMIGMLVDAGFDEDSAALVVSHVIDEHHSQDEGVWALIDHGASPRLLTRSALRMSAGLIGGPKIWPRERSRMPVGAMPRR